MIEKYLKIQAPKEDLIRELRAYETWPDWWPGVQSVRVLKNEPTLSIVDLVIRTVTTINMTLEIAPVQEDIIKFRQLKGWFKSYSGDWMLRPTPDGGGTTLKITIALDSGFLVPRGMVYAKLSDTFNLLEDALNKRLQGKKSLLAETVSRSEEGGQRQPSEPQPRAKKLAHIFQTEKGLEVWVRGRRYLMK